ncbi:MAG: xanthine dehydrogenase family protein subunit M [Anaerolineae bacterium]|nr:xanthine dehydrogenase family protein subunit M [Anaerolineae bacterium]
MAMNRFAYARATTVSEALEALGEGCRPLAGGTDLLSMVKEDLIAPECLVDVKRLPGLDRIEEREDGLHIGAMVRLSALANDPAVSGRTELACLYEALLHTASPQLRHMATLGGNLLQRPHCWYFRNKLTHCLRKGGKTCYAFRGESKYHAILGGGPCYIVHVSDPAVALLALDASVTVVGPEGERTVPLSEFYLLPREDAHREAALAPGELLTEVTVPIPPAGARGAYHKVAERQSWDFCLASAAALVVLQGDVVKSARVTMGGVAPVPWRASEAEQTLVGQALDSAAIEAAALAATSGARPLQENAYKVELAQGVVRQVLRSVQSG